jgi:hypothetical protein
MEQTQQMIVQQLTALSERHSALGHRLVQAANNLLNSGTPISESLLAELVKYSRDFNQVQQQLKVETQNSPNAEISLTDLKQRMQNQVQPAARSTLRQNSLKLLEGILSLAHKEQDNYQPLQTIQQQANQLKTLISTATETDSLPQPVQELASGQHPLSALLTLIEQQDHLNDSQWVVLEEKVAEAFGKALAIAISRGKIYQATNNVQPQPIHPDIVILEEPTSSPSQDIIIVPSLEIPQTLPQTQTENIVFGNAPIAGQSSAPTGSMIGLNITVHLQGLGERQFSAKEYAGTRGQGRPLEGFAISLEPKIPDLSLQYMAHVSGVGDTPMASAGQWVGETGRERQIEGFAIALTGSQARNYDVFYNAHIQNRGDVPVCSNGEYCGTRGQSLRVEGISVWIQPKS